MIHYYACVPKHLLPSTTPATASTRKIAKEQKNNKNNAQIKHFTHISNRRTHIEREKRISFPGVHYVCNKNRWSRPKNARYIAKQKQMYKNHSQHIYS